MSKAHQNPENTAQTKNEGNALAAHRVNTINRKQTPMQSSTQTRMDLWNSAMEDSLQFQHQNPPALSIKHSPILNAPWYINNHRIHKDLQMNTVLSEIKKLNTKYLRELENHTNALAVNLLDNSETRHRLKRYKVNTLPDRPE
jgi:hypothetical protein